MIEYTPTTAQIRTGYASVAYTDQGADNRLNDFDRWLNDTERKAAVKALRDMAARVRADFASAGMMCGWVGALDDEATRLESL